MRKGQLWISAVLYIALGVVAITLVLSAGLPLINKMKDRNTFLQAKEVLTVVDNAINDVKKEGIGSKRYLSPVIIKGGEMVLDKSNEKIRWKLRTNAVMVEPCKPENLIDETIMLEDCLSPGKNLVLREGNLYYYQTETIVKGEYDVRVELSYRNKINLDTNNANPLTGKYSFSIENLGLKEGSVQTINIDVT